MQEETTEAKLRCVCGHRIVSEVWPSGKHIGYLAFFDDEPTSGIYRQRVKSCPSCGEQIGFSMLHRKNRSG
jgi:DNA-directed RNA polymerase subunit RPC12/RpoP